MIDAEVNKGYQTYGITQPSDRLVVSACHEVDCPAWRKGWSWTIDERTDSGWATAYAVRRSGRDFREQRTGDGLTVFTFPPGQRCFQNHRTQRQIFRVSAGHADNAGPRENVLRVHVSGLDWVEDMQENQQKLIDLRARG